MRRPSRLAAAIDAARALARGGAVLVEELVAGPELGVTGFSAGGVFVPLAVTERICAEVPAFGVPVAQLWPAPHAETAAEVARRAVAALGIDEGPTLHDSPHEPRRARGDRGCSAARRRPRRRARRARDGHPAQRARDPRGPRPAARRRARSTPAFDPRAGGAALRFLTAPPGTLESVEVPQGLSGVVSTRIYREPGHVFGPLRRASDRAGALLAVGATRDEALARAEAAVERHTLPDGSSSRGAVALADVRTASD